MRQNGFISKGRLVFKDDFFNESGKNPFLALGAFKRPYPYPSPMENEFLHQVIGKMKVQGGM